MLTQLKFAFRNFFPGRRRVTIFVLGLLFVMALIPGCAEKEKEKIYRNSDFGFSVLYPSSYQAKEIKWVNEEMGIALRMKKGEITIQAMPAGTDYEKMPFSDYVKIATSVEIQNYRRQVSIESFSSDYGVKGYKTYWEVMVHEDTDTGEVNYFYVAGPIYYFPLRRLQKIGRQPVKTVMISYHSFSGDDKELKKDSEEIARSFRYLESFRSFFNKGHHGKLYFVERNKPFRIELPANPTTGYNWYLDQLDQNYFKVRSSGYEPPMRKLPGAGGKSYWEIVPLKPGVSAIRFLYYRSWEGKDKAVEEYRLRIIIK